MVVGEREVQGKTSDFSYLRGMKTLKTALEKGVKGEFETLDLQRLEKADSAVQNRIVAEALGVAVEEYDRLVYRDKLDQVGRIKRAFFEEGKLSIHELWQGLGLPIKTETGGRKFLDKIKDSLGKSIRMNF